MDSINSSSLGALTNINNIGSCSEVFANFTPILGGNQVNLRSLVSGLNINITQNIDDINITGISGNQGAQGAQGYQGPASLVSRPQGAQCSIGPRGSSGSTLVWSAPILELIIPVSLSTQSVTACTLTNEFNTPLPVGAIATTKFCGIITGHQITGLSTNPAIVVGGNGSLMGFIRIDPGSNQIICKMEWETLPAPFQNYLVTLYGCTRIN